MRCTNCGADCEVGATVCPHCGQTLVAAGDGPEPGEGATTRRVDVTKSSQVARWGTASLGVQRQIALHIRGHSKPLIVPLGECLHLGRTDMVTGETPEVALDEYGAAELGVSRRHAALLLQEDALKVVDLGSVNATFINGQKLLPNQPCILRDGDELRLGKMVIRIQFL
ncbi:MAG: forkhead-associated protein [Anaerolineae bacterium]|nr:MAG: forkhead-associated protein [Anaerolineae bacterium]